MIYATYCKINTVVVVNIIAHSQYCQDQLHGFCFYGLYATRSFQRSLVISGSKKYAFTASIQVFKRLPLRLHLTPTCIPKHLFIGTNYQTLNSVYDIIGLTESDIMATVTMIWFGLVPNLILPTITCSIGNGLV